MFSILPKDIGIDLGTANVVIYIKGQGIVLNEPSMVALKEEGKKLIPIAFGKEAKGIHGRYPIGKKFVKPMKDGVINSMLYTKEMLKYFIQSAVKIKSWFGPKIIICVPYGCTDTDRLAIQGLAESIGASDVYLIEEPIAAALGAGLPVMDPVGSMVVDIGGGTSEIGILSLGGIVYGSSIKVGGNKLDEAIINYVRKHHNLLIGEPTAEEIKMKIGAACMPEDGSDGEIMEVSGRNLLSGLPSRITLNEKQIAEALIEPVGQIVEAIKSALEVTEGELSADIFEKGITLTGGGAMLKNLDKVIRELTHLPVYIADEPLLCVIHGIEKVLSDLKTYRDVIFKQE